MRSLTYLNTILTMLALLLTLNLWTVWNTTPGGSALSPARPAKAAAMGIANAGAQRKAIVDLLKKVNVQLAVMRHTMTDGSMRVRAATSDHKKKAARGR